MVTGWQQFCRPRQASCQFILERLAPQLPGWSSPQENAEEEDKPGCGERRERRFILLAEAMKV